MDAFCMEVVARLPLAESVMKLWSWALRDEHLEGIWDEHRGRCYERVISFSLMVRLVTDALLTYDSGHESFQKNVEKETLDATVQAAYKKLSRLPIAVSEAFLRDTTEQLRHVFPAPAKGKKPASLNAFTIMIYDGKTIKNVVKRLQPLRGISGGLRGGSTLVAIEWETGLAVAMRADPDGDANNVKYVKELVPIVNEKISGPCLNVSDRGFSDLEQPCHFTAREGDHFVIRHHSKVKFHVDPTVPARHGTLETGEKYMETWGWIGSEKDPRRRRVRQIELFRPGDKSIVLHTDLLDADRYPACDVLWVYRERWTIEVVFQKVTEVFRLDHLIGGTPEAGLFQFAFCLVLYNLIQVVRGDVATAHDLETEEISSEMMFRDVVRELTAWHKLIPIHETISYFEQPLSRPKREKFLTRRLADAWSETWTAAPEQKVHRVTPKKRARTHSSVFRVLFGPPKKKKRKNLRPPRCLKQ